MMARKRRESEWRSLQQILESLRACVEPWGAELAKSGALGAGDVKKAWDDLCARTAEASESLAGVEGRWQGISRDFRSAVGRVQLVCDGWLSALSHLGSPPPRLTSAVESFKEKLDRLEASLPEAPASLEQEFRDSIAQIPDTLRAMRGPLEAELSRLREELGVARKVRQQLETDLAAAHARVAGGQRLIDAAAASAYVEAQRREDELRKDFDRRGLESRAQLDSARSETQAARAETEAARRELEAGRAETEAARQQVDAFRREAAAARAEASAAAKEARAEAELAEKAARAEALAASDAGRAHSVAAAEAARHQTAEIERLQAELAQASAARMEAENRASSAVAEGVELQARRAADIERLQTELAQASAARMEAENRAASLAGAGVESARRATEIERLQTKLAEASSARIEAENRAASLTGAGAESARVAEVEKELAQARYGQEALTREIEKMRAAAVVDRSARVEAEAKSAAAAAEIEALRRQVAAAKAKIEKLSEELEGSYARRSKTPAKDPRGAGPVA